MDHTREKTKIQPLINLIIVILVIIALVFIVSKEMGRVRTFISESGWIGLLVSVFLYALLGASPIPSEPLTILLSTIFGPFAATMVAGVGNLLAALVEYYIGERIGNVASFVKRRETLPFGLGNFPVDSAIFMIGCPHAAGLRAKICQRYLRRIPRPAVELYLDGCHPHLPGRCYLCLWRFWTAQPA